MEADVEIIETCTVCGRSDTALNLVGWYCHLERRLVHSDCWIAAYESGGLPPSMKPAEDHTQKRASWYDVVSVAVSVLSMMSVAGSVSGEETEAMTAQPRKVIEKYVEDPASQRDYRDVTHPKAQTPSQQLQTDRAMEQSSKALEELRKHKEKEK
jgi:hypothetical protein